MKAHKRPSQPMHIRISQQFLQQLKALAKLQSRSLREQVQYLLEAVLAARQKAQRFRVYIEPSTETENQTEWLKFGVTEEVHEMLFHMAGEYGMTAAALVRSLLWTALTLHNQLVGRRFTVRKEEFVTLILEVQYYQTIQ